MRYVPAQRGTLAPPMHPPPQAPGNTAGPAQMLVHVGFPKWWLEAALSLDPDPAVNASKARAHYDEVGPAAGCLDQSMTPVGYRWPVPCSGSPAGGRRRERNALPPHACMRHRAIPHPDHRF